MIIGGLQKFSILDYPEKLSAIVFTKGCNFRCHFCYNPELVLLDETNKTNQILKNKKGLPDITEEAFFAFLKSRVNKLDAVVITGGEPTLHSDLPDFVKKIKELGFLVKLDTNGTSPEMVEKLLKKKLIDYIAMDIKASREKYDQVTGVKNDIKKIKKSIKVTKKSGLPYEFRSTLVPDLMNKHDIKNMGELIEGAEKWFLQSFKSDVDMIDNKLKNKAAYTGSDLEEMRKLGERFVKKCLIR